MIRLLSFIIVLAVSASSIHAQSDSKDEPLLPQNNEFFENFAEQLMQSFNIEDIEEQMLQLTEQLKGYSNDLEGEPYEWIDSLKNGMIDGEGFFFLNPNGGDQLGMQFGDMQEMLQPMLDSMMNGGLLDGGMFQQFNFGDLGDMQGGNFDMKQFFGDKDMGALRNFGNNKMTFAEKMEAQMWNDKLLQTEDINQIEITGKHLKINGVKQSQDVFEKYRDLFEASQGHALTPDSTIKLNFGNEAPKTKMRRAQRI